MIVKLLRFVAVLLLGLALIALGRYGGGFVGFGFGYLVGWMVSIVVETSVSVLGAAVLGSLVGGALMAVTVPAFVCYRYAHRKSRL